MIDELIRVVVTLDSFLSGHPVFIMTLLGTGLFFTLYLGFPQIRYFRKAVSVVRGKHDNAEDAGDASHFQALATALSGTVGTGNIAGVALAIHLGGPAALFWMMMTAVIGMATKFVEVTLSHKYRVTLPDGTIAGGPMYYMNKRLNIRWNGRTIRTGRWVAIVFSACTIVGAFGTGCFPQVNSIATSMHGAFGVAPIAVGAVLAVILALVILGGIRRIVVVTEKLVPFMAVAYFVSAIVVIAYNSQNIWPSLCSIFSDMFSGTAATGGFLGATASLALSRGVNRGLFSNEAGQGSAPIAHAAARCSSPAAEGLVALLEPFIDTVIICMLTGLMILSSGAWKTKYANTFQEADTLIVGCETTDVDILRDAMEGKGLYSGMVEVSDGVPNTTGITIMHNHSVAEDVFVTKDNTPFTGALEVEMGHMKYASEDGQDVTITGKSLIHSAQLTSKAFAESWFGEWGQYIVTFSLLLFAFSTSIAWSYYGDRASAFLFGAKAVVPFRVIYVIGFFIGSFTDTSVAWSVASIGIVMMAMPNLIGLLLLHKEMKRDVLRYVGQLED